MWNPSSRNLPDQPQIRDSRGPTFHERILSGCRYSGNYLFPLFSPTRSDRLPLLESMTPRFLDTRYRTVRHTVKPAQIRRSFGIEEKSRQQRAVYSRRAGLVLLPHVGAVFRHDPPVFN